MKTAKQAGAMRGRVLRGDVRTVGGSHYVVTHTARERGKVMVGCGVADAEGVVRADQYRAYAEAKAHPRVGRVRLSLRAGDGGYWISPQSGVFPSLDDARKPRKRPVTAKEASALNCAPELYEALKDCAEALERLPNVDGAFRVTCLTQARAALARAEGQTP